MMLNMIKVGENYINYIDEQILGPSCVLQQPLIGRAGRPKAVRRRTENVYFVRKERISSRRCEASC